VDKDNFKNRSVVELEREPTPGDQAARNVKIYHVLLSLVSTLVYVQVRHRHVHYVTCDSIKQKHFSVEIGLSVGFHEARGVAESGEVIQLSNQFLDESALLDEADCHVNHSDDASQGDYVFGEGRQVVYIS
jgi:hypothetical protein